MPRRQILSERRAHSNCISVDASTSKPATHQPTQPTQLNPIRFIFVNFYGCLQLEWQMCPFSCDIFRVAVALLIHRLIACFDSIGHFYSPIMALINYLSYQMSSPGFPLLWLPKGKLCQRGKARAFVRKMKTFNYHSQYL